MQLRTTAVEAEARKIDTYRELIDNGYFFQLGAMEVQGSKTLQIGNAACVLETVGDSDAFSEI